MGWGAVDGGSGGNVMVIYMVVLVGWTVWISQDVVVVVILVVVDDG